MKTERLVSLIEDAIMEARSLGHAQSTPDGSSEPSVPNPNDPPEQIDPRLQLIIDGLTEQQEAARLLNSE